MWQFAEACRGLKDACVELGIPVTGGNVSLYNQTGETAILPTPVVAVLGVIEDVTRRTPTGFQAEGHRVLLLGETREELSGSEWAHVVHGHLGGTAAAGGPRRRAGAERAAGRRDRRALLGARPLRRRPRPGPGRVVPPPRDRRARRARRVAGGDPFVALFSESAGRVLVTVAPDGEGRLFELAADHGVPVTSLGQTRGDVLSVTGPVRRTPRGAAHRLDLDPARRAGLSPGPTMRSQHIRALTGLRFFAALWVVLYHSTRHNFPYLYETPPRRRGRGLAGGDRPGPGASTCSSSSRASCWR